jgi:hypothetical protein
VDGAPAVADVAGDLLGLVDGNLGRLELLALGDDRPGLLELRAQLVGVRVRLVGRKRCPSRAEGPVGSGRGDRGTAEQNGEPAPHAGDATVSAALPRPGAAQFPGDREPARPPQTEGSHEGT